MSGAAEGLAAAFAYDRTAVAAGEGWRLFTGLASHWSTSHAVADGVAVALLAAAIARREGARVLFALLAVAVLTQAAALAWLSDATQYRGSSGIAWALGTYALTRSLEPGRAAQCLAAAMACALAILAPAAGVSVLPAGVLPDSAMHIAGALAGAALASDQRLASVNMSSLLRFT